MKHIYRIFILLGLLLIFHTNISFPQYVSYGYDATGNRIKREIVMSTYNNIRKAPQKASVSECLSDRTIKIYPNPTKGMLKIEIGGWTETDRGSITIHSTNGAILITRSLTESSMTFDITNYSAGIYLMHIKIGDKGTTWKIIKE